MRIPVFVHTANPAVDKPLCHRSRSRVLAMLTAGIVAMVNDGTACQYVSDRRTYIETAVNRTAEIGYDRTVNFGRRLVWVPSGLTWQMKPCYGSMARHFTSTKAGMNFAPNKSTSPREHRVTA
jgi:hypothetical protein